MNSKERNSTMKPTDPETTFQARLDARVKQIIQKCHDNGGDGRGYKPEWEKVAAYDELIMEWADKHPNDIKALIEGSAKVTHDN